MPLPSPAIMKDTPMKEVFAVSYAAQREEIDHLNKSSSSSISLNEVSNSALLAKREKKKAVK